MRFGSKIFVLCCLCFSSKSHAVFLLSPRPRILRSCVELIGKMGQSHYGSEAELGGKRLVANLASSRRRGMISRELNQLVAEVGNELVIELELTRTFPQADPSRRENDLSKSLDQMGNQNGERSKRQVQVLTIGPARVHLLNTMEGDNGSRYLNLALTPRGNETTYFILNQSEWGRIIRRRVPLFLSYEFLPRENGFSTQVVEGDVLGAFVDGWSAHPRRVMNDQITVRIRLDGAWLSKFYGYQLRIRAWRRKTTPGPI